MLISPQAAALILVSVGPTRAQLIGDIDKDALKAKVEEQTDEPEKDSKFILHAFYIKSFSHYFLFRKWHCCWRRGVVQQRGYNADIDCDNGYLQWHDLPQRSLQELDLYDRVHTTRGKLGQAHVTRCHAMSRHRDTCCDAVLRLTGRGSFPACLEYFLPNEQSWRCPLNTSSFSGFDPLHPAAAVMQHNVHWRGGGGGVLQHRGGAAPQEAGDQSGPGISREVQIPDPGETPAEWLQREVSCWARRPNLDNRKNVDPQIVKWNARKKLHYTEEVILPDPFFLLPIILNFLTSSWLNFSVEHENCA